MSLLLLLLLLLLLMMMMMMMMTGITDDLYTLRLRRATEPIYARTRPNTVRLAAGRTVIRRGDDCMHRHCTARSQLGRHPTDAIAIDCCCCNAAGVFQINQLKVLGVQAPPLNYPDRTTSEGCWMGKRARVPAFWPEFNGPKTCKMGAGSLAFITPSR